MQRHDFIVQPIEDCEARIDPAIGTGTVLTASEVGPDFSAFPPNTSAPGWGWRPQPGSAAAGHCQAGDQGDQTRRAGPSNGGHGGAKQLDLHRRQTSARLARKGTAVAITATARELACLIYLMVTRGEEYVEKGMDAYEKRRIDRTFANLNRKARTLGYRLVQAVVDEEVLNGVPTAAQLLERTARTCWHRP